MHKCLVTNAGSINYTLITNQSEVERSISHLPAHEAFFFSKQKAKKIVNLRLQLQIQAARENEFN